jgi:hypothetical protein
MTRRHRQLSQREYAQGSAEKVFDLVWQLSQREYECGSHECGQNTSRGLRRFRNLSAVYLREHGPKIVFHCSIDPQVVINFKKPMLFAWEVL